MAGQYRKPTELTQEEFDALPLVDVEFQYKPATVRQPEYFGFRFILFDEMTFTSDQLKEANKVSELDFLRMKAANGWPSTLSKNRDSENFIGNVVRFNATHAKHYQLSKGMKHVKHANGEEKDYVYYAVDIFLSDMRHYKTFFLSKEHTDYIESNPDVYVLFNDRKSNKEGGSNEKAPTSLA